jgi:hypothetical protein
VGTGVTGPVGGLGLRFLLRPRALARRAFLAHLAQPVEDEGGDGEHR